MRRPETTRRAEVGVAVRVAVALVLGALLLPVAAMAGTPGALPSCNDLDVGEAELESVVQAAIAGHAEPWDTDHFAVLEDIAAMLGCELPIAETVFADGFETGDMSVWSSTSADGSDPDARRAAKSHVQPGEAIYLPHVSYCGPGNSLTHPFPLIVEASGDLNRSCYDHDACYRPRCIRPLCYWAERADIDECDAPFFASCEALCAGGCTVVDRILCLIPKLLEPVPRPAPGCDLPPCDSGAGDFCCYATGECQPAVDEAGEVVFCWDGCIASLFGWACEDPMVPCPSVFEEAAPHLPCAGELSAATADGSAWSAGASLFETRRISSAVEGTTSALMATFTQWNGQFFSPGDAVRITYDLQSAGGGFCELSFVTAGGERITISEPGSGTLTVPVERGSLNSILLEGQARMGELFPSAPLAGDFAASIEAIEILDSGEPPAPAE